MILASINPPQSPVLITIFGIDILWYGFLIAIGMLLGIYVGQKEANRYGIDEEEFSNMMLAAIFLGVLGARLYYVIFQWNYYSKNLLQIINIRQGGLAIHGGIIAGMIFIYLYSKKKDWSFWTLADASVPGLALGQSIGRWGNFFNQEAYGRATELPWGMWINGVTVHPTFLYESLFNFFLFFFLLYFAKNKKKEEGDVFFIYGIGYGIARFFIEGLRTDSLYFFCLRIAQIVSLIFVAVGIIGLIKNRRKKVGSY